MSSFVSPETGATVTFTSVFAPKSVAGRFGTLNVRLDSWPASRIGIVCCFVIAVPIFSVTGMRTSCALPEFFTVAWNASSVDDFTVLGWLVVSVSFCGSATTLTSWSPHGQPVADVGWPLDDVPLKPCTSRTIDVGPASSGLAKNDERGTLTPETFWCCSSCTVASWKKTFQTTSLATSSCASFDSASPSLRWGATDSS